MANFVRHISCEKCGSSDANALYDDGSQYCFSCNSVVRSSGAYNATVREKKIMTDKDIKNMTDQTKEALSMDEYEELKTITTTKPNGFRGIRDDISSKFGVRYLVENEQVVKQYCPVTEEGHLVGLKIRDIPKVFSTIGRVGKKSDLFMQFKFTKGGKYLLITEGECFLPDTKVLTKSGWINIKDYTDGEVMQGDGTFATPIAKISKHYSGNLINYKSGSYQMTTTPEHDMIRIIKGNYVKVKANDKTKKHLPVPRVVNYETQLTSQEVLMARLQVMFSADFTFREDGDIYGCLKKQRKIDRCVDLLNKSGIRYSHNKDSRGYSSFFIHRGHGLDVSKHFDYQRDLHRCKIIIDEIVHWDGNTVPNRNQIEYSSVILHNAEFIQTCAHLCGYTSSIIPRIKDEYDWYKVSILFGKQTSSTQQGYTEIPYDNEVYCLTMPSGSLLVKENQSISVNGNCDALSAYQMLNDYNASKNSPFETAVVSPIIGANSAAQLKHNYKFIDTFDQIIICYDNDKTGQEAIEDIIPSLPKGKIKIMKMRYKDANEYLQAGKEKEFVTDFYNAETYVPVGVLGSSQLYDKILAQAATLKVPFPPFMNALNDKLVGGMPLGHIINIGAKTGIGKTTVVNELIYYWVMNSPHKAGVVSMELDSGQYGEVLLSRHLSSKLALIKSNDDKNAFLSNEIIKKRASELFTDSNGNDRFFVLDNRDGSVEEIQNTIEELIISCGCKIIILDPLQDILAGLSIDEQELFMKWVKGSIKSHGVTFILINHMRKSQGPAHDVDEEDFQGSSTIIKSASVNIILSRDKSSDDDVERNTTRITVTKNRITGLTGPAGEVYYDNESHTLHDINEFFTDRHKH